MSAQSRLLKEYREALKSQDDEIQLKPMNDDNIFEWICMFKGPADTGYEGGLFEVRMSVCSEYPIRPPRAVMLTKIFHPNVHFKVWYW